MLTANAPSAPPHGLSAILSTFGDPRPFIAPDASIAPTWEARCITRVRLPRPMRFAHSEVSRIACHASLARHFRDVLQDVEDMGFWDHVEFGGSYVVRPIHGGGALSTHAWGIAIDLIPVGPAMPPEIVALFAHYGFTWGGPLDPSHFQFATGYGLTIGHRPVDRVAWVPPALPSDPNFIAA